MDDMQKWLKVIEETSGKQTLMENDQPDGDDGAISKLVRFVRKNIFKGKSAPQNESRINEDDGEYEGKTISIFIEPQFFKDGDPEGSFHYAIQMEALHQSIIDVESLYSDTKINEKLLKKQKRTLVIADRKARRAYPTVVKLTGLDLGLAEVLDRMQDRFDWGYDELQRMKADGEPVFPAHHKILGFKAASLDGGSDGDPVTPNGHYKVRAQGVSTYDGDEDEGEEDDLRESLAAKLREFMEEPVIAERTGRKVGPAVFTNVEYQDIRRASQRGRFVHDFESSEPAGPNGERDVTFYTDNLRKLCSDLESIVDFGATTAAEVLDIDPHVVTENAEPTGPRYDYEATPEGGVRLYDLHSGKDGYLQPGDEAGTFFDELEEWEAEGNEFDDEFMEMYGYWSVIDTEESVSEDAGSAGYLLRSASVAPFIFFVDRVDRGYEPDQQRENWTRDHKQATVYSSAEEAAAATKNMRGIYAIVTTDNPDGTPVAEGVNGTIQDYRTHESKELNERESTSSVEYRDPHGRFNVIYNYNRRQYKVHPMPDFEGLIEPNWFDSLKDAIEHAELELEGASEGIDEETVNEDWGSSDWSAVINMMDRELESMGAVNPENIESAAQNVAEFYYEDMGYDHPDDAVESIIAMYMQRKGWGDLLGETAELKRLAGL